MVTRSRIAQEQSETAHRMPAALYLRSRGKPIAGDRGLLDLALDFANSVGDRFVGWESADEDEPFMKEWRARKGTTTRDRMPSSSNLASERRAQLRDCLTEFLEKPANVQERFVRELSRHLDDIEVKPTWRMSGKSVLRTDELWPFSWSALLAYIALLLLDENRGFGAALCRCRLDSCQRFFLAKKPATGRPRRDYHSDDCMKRAHALNSTERAQKSRARKARKSK